MLRASVSLCLFALFALPAVAAPKIEISQDPEVDLTSYRTYAWTTGNPAGSPQVEMYIVQAVEKALSSKGYAKVASEDEADLLVATWVFSQYDVSLTGNYAVNPTFHTGFFTAHLDGTMDGVLIVDIVDREKKEAVWRGKARKTILHLGTSLDKAQKIVNQLTGKLFRKFPER